MPLLPSRLVVELYIFISVFFSSYSLFSIYAAQIEVAMNY